MIKAQIGCLLYNSMERQQPWQSPFRNVQQQVISSFSEVETEVECRGSRERVERWESEVTWHRTFPSPLGWGLVVMIKRVGGVVVSIAAF